MEVFYLHAYLCITLVHGRPDEGIVSLRTGATGKTDPHKNRLPRRKASEATVHENETRKTGAVRASLLFFSAVYVFADSYGQFELVAHEPEILSSESHEFGMCS